jgi:hypothetical protein
MDKIAEAIEKVAKQWKRTNDTIDVMTPQYLVLLTNLNRTMIILHEKIEEEA